MITNKYTGLITFLLVIFGLANVDATVRFNNSGRFTLNNNCVIHVKGNWINHSNVFVNNSAINFHGAGNDTIFATNPESFASLGINKQNNGNLYLANDLTVTHSLAFTGGKLLTGNHDLYLSPDAVLTGEAAGKYIVGRISTSRYVGTGSSNFGGLGINLSAGPDNLNIITVTRTTGPAGRVVINDAPGINRKWKLTGTQQPVNGRTLSFSWVADDDNGLDLATAQLWKSTNNEASWNPASRFQNVSANRTITTSITSFSAWTVNDGSLHITGDINGDGIVSALDVEQIAQFILFGTGLNSVEQIWADLKADNHINIEDIIHLLTMIN